MRAAFCDALIERSSDPRLVFLTGDLGYNALEPLREALGARFINAGVAEQNMVSVAAALEAQNFRPWVYSIAPFCYARPFEQIRNDIAFSRRSVTLVGNGGGYGYGAQGPTHHAIEDYGVLLTLDLKILAPVFDEDVAPLVRIAAHEEGPAYLRLGRDETTPAYAVPSYAAWRRLTKGGGPTIIGFGAIASSLVEPFALVSNALRPNLWALAELPLERHPLPQELMTEMATAPGVAVVEEHVRHGGLASALALQLALTGSTPRRFASLHARTHRDPLYGSQGFLRIAQGLDPKSVLEVFSI